MKYKEQELVKLQERTHVFYRTASELNGFAANIMRDLGLDSETESPTVKDIVKLTKEATEAANRAYLALNRINVLEDEPPYGF